MGRFIHLVIFAVLMLVMASCRGSSGPGFETTITPLGLDKAWSTAGGDATQSGYFDWAGPDAGTINWTVPRNGMLTPLAETGDGGLYCFATDGLLALDDQGDIAWRHQSDSNVRPESFAIDDSGQLHYADQSGHIYTLTTDGSVVSTVVTDTPFGHCQHDNLGRAYVGYYDNTTQLRTTVALDSQGAERWRVEPADPDDSYLDPAGPRAYQTHGATGISAFDLDSNLVWSYDQPGMEISAFDPTLDGHCYLHLFHTETETRHLAILDPAGTVVSTTVDPQPDLAQADIDLCGPENELYDVTEDYLFRYYSNGSVEVIATEVLYFAGISPDGYIHIVVNESSSPVYRVIAPTGEAVDYPGMEFAGNRHVLGSSGRVYTLVGTELASYTLETSAQHNWTYSVSGMPTGLAVDITGTVLVLDTLNISGYNSTTGAASWQAESPLLATQACCGTYWPGDGGYILNSIPGMQSLNPTTGTDNGSLGITGGVDKCLAWEDRLYVLSGAELAIYDASLTPVTPVVPANDSEYIDLAVGRDGTAYLIDAEGGLRAVSATGTALWDLELGDIEPESVVAGDDLVLVQTATALYGVRADGTLEWREDCDGFELACRPGVSPTGLIYQPVTGYVAGCETSTTGSAVDYCNHFELRILSFKGNTVHTVELDTPISQQPLIDSRGVAYTIDSRDLVTAVKPNGDLLWQADLSDYTTTNLVQKVIAPTPSGGFFCAYQDSLIGLGN